MKDRNFQSFIYQHVLTGNYIPRIRNKVCSDKHYEIVCSLKSKIFKTFKNKIEYEIQVQIYSFSTRWA